MSGGSFEYYCYSDIGNKVSKRDEVSRMISYINEMGFYFTGHITQVLTEFLMKIDELEEMSEKLQDVFHGIEWRCSGDIGDDTLTNIFKLYIEENMK